MSCKCRHTGVNGAMTQPILPLAPSFLSISLYSCVCVCVLFFFDLILLFFMLFSKLRCIPIVVNLFEILHFGSFARGHAQHSITSENAIKMNMFDRRLFSHHIFCTRQYTQTHSYSFRLGYIRSICFFLSKKKFGSTNLTESDNNVK